jgi:hypothetical protein
VEAAVPPVRVRAPFTVNRGLVAALPSRARVPFWVNKELAVNEAPGMTVRAAVWLSSMRMVSTTVGAVTKQLVMAPGLPKKAVSSGPGTVPATGGLYTKLAQLAPVAQAPPAGPTQV